MGKSVRILFIFLATLLAMTCPSLSHGAGSVSISFRQSKIREGDQVYMVIKCFDVTQPPADQLSVPGFKLLHPPVMSRPQENKMVHDGKRTYTVLCKEYTATLKALKEGNYSFGPITVGGVKSNTLKYTIENKSTAPVVAPPQTSNPFAPTHNPVLAEAGGKDLFLRVETSTHTPYEQQPVVYTVKMYSSYSGVSLIGSPSAPSFENCTYEESSAFDHKMNLERINGKTYSSGVLMRYILFPTKSGTSTIKGNVISFSAKQNLKYDDGSSQRIDIFTSEQIDIKVPDITLDVKPLPESQVTVNGVGSYTASVSFPKKELKKNQIATLKYTVKGSGNLNFVSLPDIAASLPPELKFVKAENKVNKSVTADNMTGSVEFTVTIIPVREGKFEYPPQKFNFFNPSDGNYYTVETPGTEFTVVESTAGDDKEETYTFDGKLQDIGTLSRAPGYVNSDSRFYLIYMLPFLMLAGAMTVYRRKVRISADIVGLRRKKAGKEARTRLRRSRSFMKKGKRQEFFAEMLDALWGYVSAKLNIPASDLTRDNVASALLADGVPGNTVNSLIDIIDNCELARYTNSSEVDMKEIYAGATAVINAVEDSIRPAVKTPSES